MIATRIPGPTGHPLIGSLRALRRNILDTYQRAHREYGDVVLFTAGPPGWRLKIHAVFSAEGAQRVLATESANFRKDSRVYQVIRESFGDGLLTSQDETYLRQRRLVQPLFTRRQVNRYADAICDEATAMITRWRQQPDGVIDVVDEMVELTLRVVSRVLFGTDIDAALPVVRRCFPTLSAYIDRRGRSPLRIPRKWPTPANRRAHAARRALYQICDEIVARRREDFDRQEDLVGLLTRAVDSEGARLSADEIRDQILIFLFAGHETTATTLAYGLHLLSGHPEVEEAAHKEVDQVLAGRLPTAEDLEALPYLTMVVKETMRLYPAAPLIGRRASADTTIGGYLIPAGSDVSLSPWVTHRHPEYWGQPERFDPLRFTPEREAERPRYAWFPFGGGPRACIGQHLSMLESVLPLAVILQAYRLQPLDPVGPVTVNITLRPLTPLRCRLIPR